MPAKTFEQRLSPEWPAFVIIRRIILAALAVHVTLATISGYRAWVQVKSVDVSATGPVLESGSTVNVAVVTSGRVTNDVHLALVQGDRTSFLAAWQVPENSNFFYDPRSHGATFNLRIGGDALRGFHTGRAVLRATAEGRSQFLRIPPPFVRDLRVELRTP